MHLHPNPFRKIKEGSQQIETRIYDEKRRQFKIGDSIEFISRENPEDKFLVEITDLIIKPTFSELFDTFPSELFGGKDKEDLMGIYKYYSPQEEKDFGVVGIKVRLIDSLEQSKK
ncbi:hypothetical protein C4565_04165 [Candidatus Parcubacteria bacterium]|nr:MAG: hypothetical protein C4565_04165 [Candidatus Parcubacteria bacterium]